jgi:hypothetical protein
LCACSINVKINKKEWQHATKPLKKRISQMVAMGRKAIMSAEKVIFLANP